MNDVLNDYHWLVCLLSCHLTADVGAPKLLGYNQINLGVQLCIKAAAFIIHKSPLWIGKAKWTAPSVLANLQPLASKWTRVIDVVISAQGFGPLAGAVGSCKRRSW